MVRGLLDTNVLSELSCNNPNEHVTRNVSNLTADQLFVSVLALGELMKGVVLLPAGKRRDQFERTFAVPVAEFADRTLNISPEIAMIWGSISATAKANGYQVAPVDGLIAATALHHDLIVMTRNVRDFGVTGVQVINPWDVPE